MAGKKNNYTNSDIVNKILEIMVCDIVQDIVRKKNNEELVQFCIICDETQDI